MVSKFGYFGFHGHQYKYLKGHFSFAQVLDHLQKGHALPKGWLFDIGAAAAPNSAPVITSNGGGASAALSIAENTKAVATVAASDANSDAIVFSISGGSDASLFAINSATGALSFVNAPDFESPGDANHDNVYQVTVSASDGKVSDTQTFAVTVTDMNENGFVSFGGHQYKYVKGLYTFAQAQAGAAAAGGYVATIESAAENAFLAKLIAGQDLGAWLGGSDTAVEGQWKWTEGSSAGTNFWNGGASGSPASGKYSNWSVGEPNGIWNGIEEDHLHMMANSDKWNDTSGYWSTMGYFIEIDNGSTPPANSAPVITSSGGGATAAVSVAENTKAVVTVAAGDANSDTIVFSISGGADAGLFSINSATGALAFVNAPNFEAPADANHDNVYQVTVQASDGSASDTQALAVTVTDVNENGGTPPAGFTTYNGHHYKFVAGNYTHAQAQAAAAAEGGHLATITSSGENSFLAGLMAAANAGGYGGWLGASDAAGEGQWKWVEGPEAGTAFWSGLGDGSPVGGAYTSWLAGEPSQYQGTEEDYMHMLFGTDDWNDINDAYTTTMGYFVEISA